MNRITLGGRPVGHRDTRALPGGKSVARFAMIVTRDGVRDRTTVDSERCHERVVVTAIAVKLLDRPATTNTT
jgi:hypothetical protein